LNIIKAYAKKMPMSSSSNGTYSPCKSMVEGEVMVSRAIGCMCNLPIIKEKKNLFEENRKCEAGNIFSHCFGIIFTAYHQLKNFTSYPTYYIFPFHFFQ
jgi:hypothetical protein